MPQESFPEEIPAIDSSVQELGDIPHRANLTKQESAGTETHTTETESIEENQRAIDEVRRNLVWNTASEASLQPEILAAAKARREAVKEAAAAEAAPAKGFWANAKAKLGSLATKLKFWDKKDAAKEASAARDLKAAFFKAIDRTAITLAEGEGRPLSEDEQGDIFEYLNSHPELNATKSIELLASLPRFDEKRQELLVAMVLDSVRLSQNGESLRKIMTDGKQFLNPKGQGLPFKAVLERALAESSDDHYFEHIMPLLPESDIERIARKITNKDYQLATPQEYAKHAK